MKELKEMIKIMKHYENGGEIEFKRRDEDDIKWRKLLLAPVWNWDRYAYRIEEKKQEVTIEKWLCSDEQGDFIVIETSDIGAYMYITKKLKLLETYVVEF